LTLLANWPSVADDDGTKQFGTIFNKALTDAVKASVEDNVHSTTNSTIKTKTIIDEVVTARGVMNTLDERLDASLNADGSLILPAGILTQAQAQALMGQSLVINGDLLLWRGGTSGPMGWLLSGAGAAVARTGVGLGDTTRAPYGAFALKLTSAGVAVRETQKILSTAAFARVDGLKNRKVGFGAYIKSSTVSSARLVVDDGVTTTSSGFHAGDGVMRFMPVLHTISGSATKLDVYMEVATTTSEAYFGAICGLVSDVAPSDFFFAPMISDTILWRIDGVQTAGTDKRRWMPDSYGIVTHVELVLKTGPTGAAFIIDVNNTNSGAAVATMFSGSGAQPQVAAGGTINGAVPDGPYAQRCFQPIYGTTAPTDNAHILQLDIDQVGSGTAGSDVDICVRTRKYVRPFEGALDYNDQGI